MTPLAILALLGAAATVDAPAQERPDTRVFWRGGTPSGDVWQAVALRNHAAIRQAQATMGVPLSPWMDGVRAGVFRMVQLVSAQNAPVLVVFFAPRPGSWDVEVAFGPSFAPLNGGQKQAVGSVRGVMAVMDRRGERFGTIAPTPRGN